MSERVDRPCTAGKEFHDEWIEDLGALIPEGDESRYSNPEGDVETIILDCFRVYAAERDALAATVQRVRALCDEARFYVDSHDEGGPDLPPTARLVLVADLRAALAPSDPATEGASDG